MSELKSDLVFEFSVSHCPCILSSSFVTIHWYDLGFLIIRKWGSRGKPQYVNRSVGTVGPNCKNRVSKITKGVGDRRKTDVRTCGRDTDKHNTFIN